MKMSRVIEMPDEADIYDELLEDIQDNWEESSRCDIDQYDVARAVRKLHSSGIVRMRHRDPVTGESVHRLQIGGVSNS
jgi:predicted transcriptional regulator